MAAGFVGTVYSDFYEVVAAGTFLVSTYVPDPNASSATVRAGLQNALNAVAAAGGTLTFPSSTVYTINAELALTTKDDFVIVGNGSTIKMANGIGGIHSLALTTCRNFHISGLIFDGNKANRTVDTEMVHLRRINSVNSGGGRASFDSCGFNNSPFDGCTVRGADGAGLVRNDHSENILFYKCTFSNNQRMGGFISNGHNIQYLGCTFSGQSGQKPCSGFDVEPNQPTNGGVPACSNLLWRGCTFSANDGKGIHLSTGKGGTEGLRGATIEGCYFTDGAATSDPTSQGSAIHVIAHDVLVQKNTFENWTSHRSNQAGMVVLSTGGSVASSGCLVFSNSFNNILTGQKVLLAQSTGSGNSFNGNRAFNFNGTLENGASANCTFVNNTTSSVATSPTPVPPWDVTFGGGGFIGGAIEFDAASTTGSEFTTGASWTHTPVGTPKGVVVLVAQRTAFPVGDEITGVTYGLVALTRVTNGFAVDTVSEGCGAYAYHLGAGIPTGAQTVAITVIAGHIGTFRAHCITVTADGDTAVEDSAVVQENTANPTATLATSGGLECFVAGVLSSGSVQAGVAVGADYTEIAEYEQGSSRTMSFMRRTEDSTGGDVTADWVVAISDDVAAVAVAISNVDSAPTVNVLVQPNGFSRTRALGSVNVIITNPPLVLVTPLGLSATPALGAPVVVIPIPQVDAIGYTSLTDEEMSIQLIASTEGPIDPTVVRNCLMTLRDRLTLGFSGADPDGFTLLEDFEFDLNLNDNTFGTVDPYFARSAVLTLADRISGTAAPTSPLDGSYRILTAAEMLTYMKDDTNGYVDPFVMRCAILTLRDWISQVPP